MALVPIIERELRVALRKRRPDRSRLRVGMWLGALVLFLLLFSRSTGSGREFGRTVHFILTLCGLAYALQAIPVAAAALAAERQNRTLGLLFLAGLNPLEIFVSKMLSSTMIAFTHILAMAPFLAIPFVAGAVSYKLFLATVVCLPNTLLFVLAVSLLASVLVEEEGAARLLAAALLAGCCLWGIAAFELSHVFSHAGTPSPWWLRLNPAYGPYLVIVAFASSSVHEFWITSAATFGYTVFCLLAAAATMIGFSKREQVQGEFARRSDGAVPLFARGARKRRTALAARWLDANPWVWFSARDRMSGRLGWIAIGLSLLGWTFCALLWPDTWVSVPAFFLVAIVLNTGLHITMVFAAGKALASARRDGSYELILTTPIGPGDLVWGQWESLLVQFKPAIYAVLSVGVAMMLCGLWLRHWDGEALTTYFLLWAVLLSWTTSHLRQSHARVTSMWAGLNAGRAHYAIWKTSAGSWIAILWVLSNGLVRSDIRSFPTGSKPELAIVAICFLLGYLVLLAVRNQRDKMEMRLISEFREIVREPLPDPTDPRFKKWKINERFPWGWGIAQQQLHERIARRRG